MLSLETLMREVGVDKEPRARVEAILAEGGSDLLRSVIDSLPEKQRLVLALRYYEALHVPEIAAVLGSKEASVQELLEKSIHALCRKLERAAAGKARTRMAHAEGAGR
ncbi:MAG: sigma factor-like helix-turn-helix DNA-binding protein [Candidatus Eisenbacteria bacterium]